MQECKADLAKRSFLDWNQLGAVVPKVSEYPGNGMTKCRGRGLCVGFHDCVISFPEPDMVYRLTGMQPWVFGPAAHCPTYSKCWFGGWYPSDTNSSSCKLFLFFFVLSLDMWESAAGKDWWRPNIEFLEGFQCKHYVFTSSEEEMDNTLLVYAHAHNWSWNDRAGTTSIHCRWRSGVGWWRYYCSIFDNEAVSKGSNKDGNKNWRILSCRVVFLHAARDRDTWCLGGR